MLYLIGAAITLFLAVLLIGKPRKTRADYLLTKWLLLIAAHLGLYYWVMSGNFLRFPYLLGVEIPLPLAYGPMLYLYTSELTREGPASRRHFIHFLPVFLAYIYMLPFYFLTTGQKIWVYQHEGAGFETRQLLLLTAIMLSGTFYTLFAFIRLRRHRKNIDEQFSNTEKISLTWLRYLILGMTLIWLSVFLDREEYIFTTVVGFVLFIGYFGIRQTSIFTDEPQLSPAPVHENNRLAEVIPSNPVHWNASGDIAVVAREEVLMENPATQTKYAKSGLNPEMTHLIRQNLRSLMEKERLFTDPELTLAQLSNKLGTQTNHLSQVINTTENKNFYDYINALRTGEFIRISALPKNQKYTLLHLALECGFNSKTSFNRNVKKHTGLSPRELLARQNISLQ